MNTDNLKTELQNAIGSEEPVFLHPSQLSKLSVDDLPEDVMLSVGQPRDGIMHIEWDGHFFKDAGCLKAHCQYIWTRKYWEAPLGMPFYLDLVKRSVEMREKSQKDVHLLTWDDDGAYIQLSFECTELPAKLSEAYAEVKRRITWLEESAEDVSRRAGILAAEAARDLSSKDVAVVPTRTAPQGFSALLALNPDGELTATVESMVEAAQQISTGEITRATRSVTLDGVVCNDGEIIGLVDGRLAASGTELDNVLAQVLENMNMEEREIISIYRGEDVTAQEADKVGSLIESLYPELEVELLSGEQAHYFYIIGAE